jgi:hypothetical protein
VSAAFLAPLSVDSQTVQESVGRDERSRNHVATAAHPVTPDPPVAESVNK